MQTSYAKASQMKIGELNQIFSYRHAIFVERLKWDLPGAGSGLEVDEFDRSDTFHVIARDASGQACGCARLLPTTRPYLLGEVFPQLMDGKPVPRSPSVWEISRFCSVDLASPAQRTRQADLWGCQTVLRATVLCALEQGATHLIAVSTVAMQRILDRLGVTAYRAGPPMQLYGHNVFAFWIELDHKTKYALAIDHFDRKVA